MHKKMILLIGLVDMSIACMELDAPQSCALALLPKDIAHNKIAPFLSLQSIGRIRNTSKECNNLYDVVRVCPLCNESMCLTPACSILATNYYACTKALARCAHVQDEVMFQHWWGYHAKVRNQSLSALLKRDNLTVKDQMEAYRTYYDKPENVRKAILKEVKKALRTENLENLFVAKTLFVGSNLNIFDLIKEVNWNPLLINKQTYWILARACQFNHPLLLQALCGGTVDRKWMRFIVKHGTSPLLRGLITLGALDINMVIKSKKTPLHYAAQYNYYEVIKTLLDRGAYVNCADARGMRPLHYAAKNLHVASVRALLESNDADVRFKNNGGKTALSYVSYFGWEAGDDKEDRCYIKTLLKTHVEQISQYNHAEI
jgi:hypothetical protein